MAIKVKVKKVSKSTGKVNAGSVYRGDSTIEIHGGQNVVDMSNNAYLTAMILRRMASTEKMISAINDKLSSQLTLSDIKSLLSGNIRGLSISDSEAQDVARVTADAAAHTYLSEEFVNEFVNAVVPMIRAGRVQDANNTDGIFDLVTRVSVELPEDSPLRKECEDFIKLRSKDTSNGIVSQFERVLDEKTKPLYDLLNRVVEKLEQTQSSAEPVVQGEPQPTVVAPATEAVVEENPSAETQSGEGAEVATEENTGNRVIIDTTAGPIHVSGDGKNAEEQTGVVAGTEQAEEHIETPTNETDETHTAEEGGATSAGTEVVESVDPAPIASEENIEPEKYYRAKILKDATEQTTILAERKKPWYSRLKTFTVNHPLLTTLVGAGVGIGLTLIAAAPAAAVSGWAFAVNFLGESFMAASALGAVGGASTAIVSRVVPAGKRQRLANKFMKQYKGCMLIDRAKELSLTIQEKETEKIKEARQRHRESRGLLKKLGVYKLAVNYHDAVAKIGKKGGRFFSKLFRKEASKAVATKEELNNLEKTSGKTVAVNGYLQRMRNLEAKKAKKSGKLLDDLGKGKITQEEFNEEKQYIEEDFKDNAEELEQKSIDDGYEPGLRDSKQLFGDAEALTLVEKVEKKHRTKKMKDMTDEIVKRNSKKVNVIEEEVAPAPEQTQDKVEELRAEGKNEEADRIEGFWQRHEEYKKYAKEHNLEVEEPIEVDKDGNPIAEATNPESEK